MSDIPSRALREALRDQLAPPSPSGCVDADMLAAWCDGTLSKGERATVESHAAACVRCQALLAAMAKTAAPLPARKWWQATTVRWLAPIGAVSVLAIAVWMNTPNPRLTAPASRLEMRTDSQAAPIVETPPAEAASRSAEKPTPAFKGPAAPKPTNEPTAENRERRTLDKKSAVAPVPPSAPTTAGFDAAPIAAPAAGQAPAGVQASSQPEAPSAAPQSTEAKSNAFRARSAAAAEALTILPERRVVDASVARDIQSPDQNVRWRIVPGNRVQRSTDGGITWQAQSTGTIQPLMAGVAPSPAICWLVGKAGTVLVSRDGQTWQRIAFPEAIDLTAITAADGSTATVTTADGRTFSTSDGGRTWQAQAPQNR